MDYLGETREKIGWEKAHVYRADRPALCVDRNPPDSLVEHARNVGARFQQIGVDFGYENQGRQWLFWNGDTKRSGLPHPSLRGANQLQNASGALAALDAVRESLPVSAQHIREGLVNAVLPGRFQVLPGRPTVILDVGHNPHAAAVLKDNLGAMGFYSDTFVVVGMLKDKDIQGVFEALGGVADRWYVATLDNPRGASADLIAEAIRDAEVGGEIVICNSPRDAFLRAERAATEDDRILVFGSFYTVAEIMELKGL